YSIGYMARDERPWTFFAYLNLFVASMLTLVLAQNFLVMFLGWEGVGLCSYLLIGFWFTRAEVPPAAKKAFIANRIGDVGFLLARTHVLFEASSAAQTTVVVIGALTALLAALIAIGQDDIKRILAYSTVSQLGYMFIGVGLGPVGYAAGLFHLLTHAFFKAQL